MKKQDENIVRENEQVEATKPRKNKKRTNAIKTASLAFVMALGISSIIGLSVALYYSEEQVKYQAQYISDMDMMYSRAYYDLLDGTNDLDVKLRKVSVAATKAKQQSLLYEIWGAANLAGNNLAEFESNDDGLMKAVRFMNQLGDYSHYLALRLADGNALTSAEHDTLDKLGDVAQVFKQSLSKIQTGLDEGRLFMDESGNVLGDFSEAFKEFADPAMEYPQMIYDGPFSDAMEKRETKALKGEDITEKQGADIISKLFGDAATNVKYQGETNSDIVTLNYAFDYHGEDAFVQLAKKGGMLVSFNVPSEEEQTSMSEPECCKNALSFADRAGFKDMQVVWVAEANGICYVNLAPVQNGAIIYPDLVKIKVNPVSGIIIGADATHYVYNHVERDVPAPAITLAEARAKVKLPIVGEGRLALIPLQETKETLTYEFECSKDGTYYVYIDANDGSEANILYVLDTAQGKAMQ